MDRFEPLKTTSDSIYCRSVVKTFGLTHIALAVKDPERSLAFYQKVFGVIPVYTSADFIQAQTPGSRDVLVFERGKRAGKAGGIAHFGFRLTKPSDLPKALEVIKAAGGRIREHGEFIPGEPYVFFFDPDGYEVEIWYEIPTVVDPVDSEGSAGSRGSRGSSSKESPARHGHRTR
jgi:catechol 2,3-dioxygenase-like lactoylglutathione lyase family enzyme